VNGAPGRRAHIVLYSDPAAIASHRVRMVLAEKSLSAEIIQVDPDSPPEQLRELNPSASLPTLVDQDLVLYDARVIIDYLDERYPHPPLLPTEPISRARTRLALFRIEQDWYSLLPGPEDTESQQQDKAAQLLAKNSHCSTQHLRRYCGVCRDMASCCPDRLFLSTPTPCDCLHVRVFRKALALRKKSSVHDL